MPEKTEQCNPALLKPSMNLDPTGRMGTLQQIATAVVLLSSPAAIFITGTNLVIDGALTRVAQF